MAHWFNKTLRAYWAKNVGVTKTGTVLGAILLGTLVYVCVNASYTFSDTKAIDLEWKKLDDGPVRKLKLLIGLQNSIGHRGIIYNFNKFSSLRKKHYFDMAWQNVDAANKLIEQYHIIATTTNEHYALNQLSNSLEDYQSALLSAARTNSSESQLSALAKQAKIAEKNVAAHLDILAEESARLQKAIHQSIAGKLEHTKQGIFIRTSIVSALIIASIILFLLFVETRISRPLKNIVGAIRNSDGQNLNKAVPERHRRDEIGEIARVLDVWRQGARGKARLHKEVERTAATMNLLNEIAVTANQATDTNEALNKCLSLICHYTGWEVGHAWKPADDGSRLLMPLKCWHVDDPAKFKSFQKSTNRSHFARGQGIPGTVWEKKEVWWVEYVDGQTNFPREKIATKCGLVSGVGAPVILDGEVVLVLEFFSTKLIEKNPELVEILTHICTQICRAVERQQWADKALEHSFQQQVMIDKATEELRQNAEELKSALEKEQQLNAFQREFVTMVSHEFRTPLAIIDSSAQKLIRRKATITAEDIDKRTHKIRDAVVSMTKLMNSTLTAAQMEAGKLQVSITECDLKSVIEKACERQQELAHHHNISVQQEELPDTIQADPHAVEQMLTNLLSNAVKYAPNAPNITVTAKQDDDFVELSVSDEGLGIGEDDLPKMFSRFFRAKTSTGIAGTGIGLNLVKRLIDAHGGTINVTSKAGEGSTFTVRLPIDQQNSVENESDLELREIA